MTNKENHSDYFEPNKNSMDGETKLILWNDDINTFDYVVESLIDVCAFEEVQATQLALLAHYKGKIILKTGNENDLSAIRYQLDELGLNVELI